jgi:hypothetical protein
MQGKAFVIIPDCPDIGKPGSAATARGYIFVNLPESLAFTDNKIGQKNAVYPLC